MLGLGPSSGAQARQTIGRAEGYSTLECLGESGHRACVSLGCGLICISPYVSDQSTWSADGMSVLVGRRNSSIDIYDLRTCTTRTITLPSGTGPVKALQPLRDQRHLLVSSADTGRLYDMETDTGGVPAVIGGLGTGATCLLMDPMGKYLFATSGGRGWLENGREEVGVLRIDTIAQAG